MLARRFPPGRRGSPAAGRGPDQLRRQASASVCVRSSLSSIQVPVRERDQHPVPDAAQSANPPILTGPANLAFRDDDADLSGTGGPARIAKYSPGVARMLSY